MSLSARRPPPPVDFNGTFDHVRKCAACGQPAALPLARRYIRRFGNVTNEVSQTYYRCQACGTPFVIRGMAELGVVLGLLVAFPLSGLVLTWLAIPFNAFPDDAAGLRWPLFFGLGFVLVVFGSMVVGFVLPGIQKLQRPKVPGASVPPLRYLRPHRLRRCTCGALAAVSKVETTRINGILTSTEKTYSCHECAEQFTVVQPFSLVVVGLMGLVTAPVGLVGLAAVAAGSIDVGTLLCTGTPTVFGLFAFWWVITGARDRWLRHPEDLDEPPLVG